LRIRSRLFNEALEALFSRNGVYQVVGRCSSAEDAFAHVASRPDLVLGDAGLGLEARPTWSPGSWRPAPRRG
jgi:DNA-binding NarL/FixJ family response regulator